MFGFSNETKNWKLGSVGKYLLESENSWHKNQLISLH